jgi:hypothetical protein
MKIAATVLALAVALPTLGSAGEGRYQGVSTGAGFGMFVLDTKTGEVIKLCNRGGGMVWCVPVDDTVQN